VGDYPVDVKGFRTHDKSWLRDQVFAMSQTQFQVVRHLMRNQPWDYFQFVDIGLDRIHHGFWKYHDPHHVLHEPDSPYRETVHDYYRHLDLEIGRVLELRTDETIVLVVSDHGAQRLDGGLRVNEWLVREGLLVLNSYRKEVTPFGRLDVNWEQTREWSEGCCCARVFFNVQGREPRGVIDPSDYEPFRNEIKARFEATSDAAGTPLGTLVFKPEEIYRTIRNVPPDLAVHFGGLSWRSIGGVGYPAIHIRENDTGPDDCNHAQFGAFILAGPNSPLTGEIHSAHLLDVGPTLLDLGGYEIPSLMQGRSLVTGSDFQPARKGHYSATEEQVVRDRLRGLGYVS
jgi:predicted AlkP superfamily phosphohydrolase/phosphomutase